MGPALGLVRREGACGGVKKADALMERPEQAYRSGCGSRGAVGESEVQAPNSSLC